PKMSDHDPEATVPRTLVWERLARLKVRRLLRAGVLLSRLRLKLEADERLVADHMRIVSGLDHIRVTGSNLNLGAVVVGHPHRRGLRNAKVAELALVPAHNRRDAPRPAPARLHLQASNSRAAQMHAVSPRLVGCPALVRRVEVSILHTSHLRLLDSVW